MTMTRELQAHETPPAEGAERAQYCACGAPWFMVCLRRDVIVVRMRQKHHGAWHYWEVPLDELVAEINRTAARLQ